jgi:pimeloyl-ACP methyl ester carboxylesterase
MILIRPFRGWLRALLVALVLTLGLATPGSTPVASAAGASATCEQAHFSVHVLGGPHTLRGTLCRPSRGRPRAALVLVHGTTYSRVYWDFPVDPSRYSAVRLLAGAGNLTLAIDKLGSGQSDRPPADRLTADVSSDALHQVISRLRSDSAMRTTSGKVFLVGHSSGSALSIREAAQFDDVDGVVATGFMHSFGSGSNLFLGMMHPAGEDPKFENDSSIPVGYVTTQPGVRIIWYYPFNAHERVFLTDEQTKDAVADGDPSGFVDELLNGTYARQLDVPVLDLIGDRDLSFCTPPGCAAAEDEHTFYPASPDFQITVRPRTGHNLNLHRNGARTTNLIRRWVDRHSRRRQSVRICRQGRRCATRR